MRPAAPATTVLDFDLVPRRLRHAAHARGVFRLRAGRPLRRGRGRAGEGRGEMRRHSRRCGRSDREAYRRFGVRFRSLARGDRQCRLSDPAAGASDGQAMRRGRPLRALGRDHAGHHGYGRRPAIAGRLEVDRTRISRRCAAFSPISSKRYRDTPMAGRTHLQQALPVTFGYKTSIWLAMFDRHAERLEQLKPRVLVGQFAGAAGTLASLGDQGF